MKDMNDKMGRALVKKGAAGKAMMGMKKGGMAKSGGSYRKAADGIAHKGKTKGKQIKMMRGGMC